MYSDPAVAPERLAAAVSQLAARTRQPEVRTQLHALSGILLNLLPDPGHPDERRQLVAALDAAIGEGDEAAAIAAMRRLGALDRACIRPVDFSLASRG